MASSCQAAPASSPETNVGSIQILQLTRVSECGCHLVTPLFEDGGGKGKYKADQLLQLQKKKSDTNECDGSLPSGITRDLHFLSPDLIPFSIFFVQPPTPFRACPPVQFGKRHLNGVIKFFWFFSYLLFTKRTTNQPISPPVKRATTLLEVSNHVSSRGGDVLTILSNDPSCPLSNSSQPRLPPNPPPSDGIRQAEHVLLPPTSTSRTRAACMATALGLS